MATQPTQELPYWLSLSKTVYTSNGVAITNSAVVNLPLTYYGPSIPLGEGWVYGGVTSPASQPTTALPASTTSFLASPTASGSQITPSQFPSSILVSSTALIQSSESISALPSELTSSPLTTLPTSPLSTISTQSASSSISGTNTITSAVTPTWTSSTLANATWSPTATLAAIPDGKRGGLSSGSIVAIVLVLIAFLFAVLVCCYIVFRRRRRKRSLGRDLDLDTSTLPPGPGDEHSSLLYGRQSSGESPQPTPSMAQLRHLPIATIYMTAPTHDPDEVDEHGQRRHSPPIGTALNGGNHNSGTSHGANGSNNSRSQPSGSSVASRDLFYNASPDRDAAPSPGSEFRNAEVMTAQRATRSPLARLGRMSWFGLNRNTQTTSMAATAASSKDFEEEGWVSVPSSHPTGRAQSPARALLSAPIVTSARRSSPRLVPSPPSSPPPVSYFNLRPGSRRTSIQSGTTVYFDARSNNSRDSTQTRPQPLEDHSGTSDSHEDDKAGQGPSVKPRRSAEALHSSPRLAGFPALLPATSATTPGDALDDPAPRPYESVGSRGEKLTFREGLSRISQHEDEGESLLRGQRDAEHSLSEEPPVSGQGWSQVFRKANFSPGAADVGEFGDRRFTLGQAAQTDRPRISPHSSIVSLHGETHMTRSQPASTVTSSRPSGNDSAGRRSAATTDPSLQMEPRTPNYTLSSAGSRPQDLVRHRMSAMRDRLTMTSAGTRSSMQPEDYDTAHTSMARDSAVSGMDLGEFGMKRSTMYDPPQEEQELEIESENKQLLATKSADKNSSTPSPPPTSSGHANRDMEALAPPRRRSWWRFGG